MWFFFGLCIIVVGLLGYDWDGLTGMIVSGVLCYLVLQNFAMKRSVASLEKRVRTLSLVESPCGKEAPYDQKRERSEQVAIETVPVSINEAMEPKLVDAADVAKEAEKLIEPPPLPDPNTREDAFSTRKEEATVSFKAGPDPLEQGWNRVQKQVIDFFTKGNVVVKIAWIVLFFGVGFLLKYASDRQMFPVELRYIAASFVALVILGLGWKMREKHRAYALLLQGGAIGVLYMTVFAASKIHGLIPMAFTFFILVSLVVLSGILAILQDARMTAAFGAAGGFLAPVLTSTGSGSHVMLFTYYAILNSGIFGIAWFKTWRELNLIGFAFTFGIGSMWGFSAYKPELFFSTEPFLILFFVYFAALSVLFAAKQPPRLKGYVDGSLVFGLPVIFFTLQGFLVKDMAYGLAVSALSLSLFYLVMARSLWNRQVKGMRTLTEAFLALGIVFGSLAVPLSLDGRWTAAAWALEGAALIWVGVRQNRVLARVSGFLLQAGAGLSFLSVIHEPSRSWPILNGFYLGCFSICLAALFSAFYLQKNQESIRPWERPFHGVALIWGLLWWYGAGLSEIGRHVNDHYELSMVVGFFGLTAWMLSGLYGRLSWTTLKYPLYLFVFFLVCLLMIEDLVPRHKHPFQYGGYLAWLFSLSVFYRSLFCHEKDLPGFYRLIQHRVGFLLVTALLGYEAAFVMKTLTFRASVWVFMSWGLVPSLCALFILTKAQRVSWPFEQNIKDYKTMALLPVMVFLGLWFLMGCALIAGNPKPLAYIPIINPLELIQLFVMMILFVWIRVMNRDVPWFTESVGPLREKICFAILIFIWMNAILGRSVHMFAHIPFRWETLWHSMIFQAGLSVLWSLMALLTMVWAARRGIRLLWFAGAVLLACVVLKLFCVDLSRSGTIARIVSFLATGVLMLVIGFFSPLPPSLKESSE